MGFNFADWTLEDVERHNARIKNQKASNSTFKNRTSNLSTIDKKPKYGAKKCEYGGITFDSQKERDRYIELLTLERQNKISNLQRQIPFILQDEFEFDGKKIRAIKYITDFVYTENGKIIVEDVKSEITRKDKVYQLKRKMFMYRYKNNIKEV